MFTINGVPFDTETLVNGAATSIPDTALVPGTYTIGAYFTDSDGDFVNSSQDTYTQTVKQDPTTTVVVSSINPTVFGQSTTFTATVSANGPGAGTPTGTVTFYDGANAIGTATLNQVVGNDQAGVSTAALSTGSHAISAVYNGDSDFITSTGLLTQTVNQAESSTMVTANGPVVQGQPVNFTATVTAVSPGVGLPTGTIQFTLNGAPLGTPVTMSGGQATSETIATLNPGTYTITALYSGDINFLDSSGFAGQPVSTAPTLTVLTVSPNPVTFTQPVTLTATVSPTGSGAGTPTGTVDFYDGSNLIGSGVLSGGVATFVDHPPTLTSHTFSADYLGEADFGASTSNTVVESISEIPTSATVSGSPNPSSFNQPVTLTATVTVNAPETGTPTGTVTFYYGATALGTGTLASGAGGDQATLSVSSLPVGADKITAVYAGDGTYSGSTSPAATQNVGPAATALSVQSATTSGVMSATLTNSVTGAPIAGQTLVFTVGGTQECTAVTNASGVASCSGNYLEIVINSGYIVSYAATTDYKAVTAHGGA